ncbi:MAG: alpha/beta fold hydrolase [Alphaproteobacteria bacterium]|nr:alpha/beta fold hydrolase [Alphaproteobacteria bacterium]
MLALLVLGTALAATDVTLKAEDGAKVHARVSKSDGAKKGIVLVHMLGRDATDWDMVGEKLAARGMTAIAPDLRGHGSSAKAGTDLTDADYRDMLLDVRAAKSWLKAQGVTEVSCMGASIGANLCLQAGAEDPSIVNEVLLSAGLNYKGVVTPPALSEYGNRPLLIVASDDDRPALQAANLLHDKAKGQVHLELLSQAGHGTKMLNRAGHLENMVISWLMGTYELTSGEVVVPKPGMGVGEGQIETEGKKLGEGQ